MMKVICIKDLYKSTYTGNAFISGQEYEVIERDERFVWVTDEKGNPFSFSILKQQPFHFYNDYFKN